MPLVLSGPQMTQKYVKQKSAERNMGKVNRTQGINKILTGVSLAT